MKIIETQKRGLDIGCGHLLHDGCIGVDISQNSMAEVIHNVEEGIPFADNSFDIIYCENIIEHIKNLNSFFQELHRVGTSGAKIIAKVPHYSSRYAWGDLTHVRPFSYDSFTLYGGIEGFDVIKTKLIYIDASNTLFSIILKVIFFIPTLFAYFFPRVFERFFAYIFGGIDYVYLEFKIKK